MRLSVIVSTYNSPAHLRCTLWSLECQTFRDFEVLIADDGSGAETAAVIEEVRSAGLLRLQHIWHPDRGFRKNTVLNLAVQASQYEYLVFLDGDCLVRRDLLATHHAQARPHQMLSGGSQIDLPRHVHDALTREVIARGLPFDRRWLAGQQVSLSKSWFSDKYFRLVCRPQWASWLDLLLPRAAGFVGCNSSAWKQDILRVNGFDEDIAYGVDDKDLGVRLINAGVASRRLKYALVYLHLEHERSYAHAETIQRNKILVRQRRRQRVTWIDSGLQRPDRQAA
jgi:glycosyltransferase involved in cell wall biosynthesis